MQKAILIVCLLMMSTGSVLAADSPYAGLETRQIKALSPQQVDDLRAGRGMGLALAAELNDYPGPRHVLDLSDRLGLSEEQRTNISNLFNNMSQQAKILGGRILETERHLDSLFAGKRANDESLRAYTAEIGRLNGELRYVHLRYHLAVRAALSEAQIARYGALRGYGRRGTGAGGAHGGHGGQGMHK